jgi:translation initiation factor IF-2
MGGFNDDTIPQTSPAGTAQQASADKVTQASSQAQFSRILSALNPNQLPKHALSGSQASAIPDKNMSYTDRFANLVADNKFGANYELEKMKILVSKIGESIKKPTTRTQLNSELALIPPEYKDDPVYFKRTFPKLTSHIEVLEEKIAERTAELKVLEEQQREIETKRKLIELENKNAIPLKPMQTIASLAAISRTSARKIIDLMREIEDVPRTALALISAEQAELVLTTLGKKVRMSGFDTTVDGASMVAIDEEELILGETQFEPRAPVVTIVGHVDHGKTTLLDSLRKTSVAKHEAGRITQSIGGFNVDIPQELKEFIPSITFLDTPGHAIFKHMRARGTNKGLADLAVLLVAATDGVQPMTKESAQMIQQSGIPHVVAITKVDVQGSSPKKAMEELWTQCGIKTTHIGGDVPSIEVSALKGIGLEELVEQIAMTATDKDIFFKPRRDFNTNTVQEWNRHARSIAKSQPIQLHVLDTNNQIEGEVTEIEDMALGYAYVVESKNTHGGAYVDVIVRQGSIKVGDPVVCGLEFGTVRSITNSNGESIQEASGRDSTPVRILGLTPKDITALGEDIIALPTRELAESIAERRDYETMAQDFLTQMDIENNTVREKVIPQRHQVGRRSRALQIRGSARDQAELEAEENKTIYVSLKADVKGTLDALLSYVDDLEASPHAHHVVVKVVKAALGPEITRDDVDFAHTRGNVHILGFNTKITNKIQSYAGEHKVEMFASDVIFDVFDEFRKLLSTKLPTTPQDTVLGSAIIQQMFPIQQSRLQLKRLAVEASLSISGDPVPIVGVPQVLGSRVLSGEIVRMGQAAGDLSQVYWRIRRPNTSAGGRDEYVHQDLQCLSIRHFKDQVQKVAKGQECGIMLNQCDGALPGDFLECYRVKYVHEQFDDSIARGFNRNEEPEWKKWSQQ